MPRKPYKATAEQVAVNCAELLYGQSMLRLGFSGLEHDVWVMVDLLPKQIGRKRIVALSRWLTVLHSYRYQAVSTRTHRKPKR